MGTTLVDDSDDPGQAAGDHALTLCVNRLTRLRLTPRTLIGIAEHVAESRGHDRVDREGWIIRLGRGWVTGDGWTSGAFKNGSRLRQLITVDRWPEEGDLSILHAWAVQGECAIYEMEMDLLIAVIGIRRDEKCGLRVDSGVGASDQPWS